MQLGYGHDELIIKIKHDPASLLSDLLQLVEQVNKTGAMARDIIKRLETEQIVMTEASDQDGPGH